MFLNHIEELPIHYFNLMFMLVITLSAPQPKLVLKVFPSFWIGEINVPFHN